MREELEAERELERLARCGEGADGYLLVLGVLTCVRVLVHAGMRRNWRRSARPKSRGARDEKFGGVLV